MDHENKLVLKAVAKALTVDEMISRLEHMKKVGVPGEAILNMDLASAEKVREYQVQLAEDAVAISNREKSSGYKPHRTPDDIEKELRRKEAVRKAVTTLWVEYEA